ncbi:hydroxyisourate hydrolase [Pseudobacteriovorax antillogorgiicola]|uniref:5-hydroxyisourate hydrolase n=1 Tax=Pseudobacteriovorax antillogorgiicola TaxID=1513793 RepID=A0A1Y6BYE5_9BACT|nr:hydroxyisourate hydrolase [Pseudobacteriovorax antillogorgiicola]TCS52985.1 5-hydroxyisourate hydrolase [Pseudobacteriovorax antillogorgiicola]SMF27324.1 5-hydroxyisourate hydrolase [Pseudobacteriovorax antillogorgiicola]
MGRLTTHVLDTASGKPAGALLVTLSRISNEQAEQILEIFTNPDGRTDKPLLDGPSFREGTYALSFHVAPYFAAQGTKLPDPPFLDIITIRFSISDKDQHYHVPLLFSPWSYSTYRGS